MHPPAVGRLHPLQERILDGVLGQLHVFENAKPTHRIILIQREQSIYRPVAPTRRDQTLVQLSHHHLHVRNKVDPPVHIGASMILFIGIVRHLIVLEPVRPPVVVHIHPEQKLRPIHPIPQKRFLVVRHQTRHHKAIVLIEVRNAVEVLIEPGEHRMILSHLIEPLPICRHVLIVVVIYKFVHVAKRILIVNIPPRIHRKARGAIVRIHTESLSEHEPRIGPLRHIQHPRIRQGRSRMMLLQVRIGISAIPAVDVELPVHVHPQPIVHLHRKAIDLIGRGQPVVEPQKPDVRIVLDVPIGPRHHHKHRIARLIGLTIGRHLHPIIVGDHQFHHHLLDLRQVRPLVRRTEKIVRQTNLLLPIRSPEALSLKSPLDHRLEPDLTPPNRHTMDVPDEDIFAEKRGPPLQVLRGIVAQYHLHNRQILDVLLGGKLPLEGIAIERKGLRQRMGLMGVYVSTSQRHVIPHPDRRPPSHQVRTVGPGDRLLRPAHPGRIGPRKQYRSLDPIRCEIETHPVKRRLIERHRSQHIADNVPDGHRIMVLPLRIRSDQKPVEPRLKLPILKHAAAQSPGLILLPVVDQPSPRHKVPVQIVERIPLQRRIHIPFVKILRIIGVLPLLPPILVEQLLRHVPFLHSGI